MRENRKCESVRLCAILSVLILRDICFVLISVNVLIFLSRCAKPALNSRTYDIAHRNLNLMRDPEKHKAILQTTR